MKYCILIAMMTVLVMPAAYAQPDPRIQQFESLSDEGAFSLYMDTNESPEAAMGMMRSALRDKRGGLIARFFKEYYSWRNLFPATTELADPEYRGKIVVMMLREDSGFWPYEGPVLDGSRGVTFDNAIEPFVGTIRRYLSDVVIDEKLFSTKAGRLKLAGDLESAMAKEEMPSAKDAILPENPTRLPSSTSPVSPPDAAQQPAEDDSRTPLKNKSWSNPWTAGVVVAAVVAFLLLLMFKKRK